MWPLRPGPCPCFVSSAGPLQGHLFLTYTPWWDRGTLPAAWALVPPAGGFAGHPAFSNLCFLIWISPGSERTPPGRQGLKAQAEGPKGPGTRHSATLASRATSPEQRFESLPPGL